MQEAKVLNVLNHNAEMTSEIINEWLSQGWQLFNVILLEEKCKTTMAGHKVQCSSIMVVLVREKE